MKKKLLSVLLCVSMLTAMITGCGKDQPPGNEGSSEQSSESSAVQEESKEEAEESEEGLKVEAAVVTTSGYEINTDLDLETEVTLDIVGPALFQNENETTDLVSGLVKPGYSVIADRWNELYPNVKLNFNICPWSDWQSSITTACLDGNADVIMHGATMIDLTEDLAPYIEADSGYRDKIYVLATRRTTEKPSEWKVSGISGYTAPWVVWVDVEKFKAMGVELPSDDWTIEEFMDIAQRMTGKNPDTGEDIWGMQMYSSGGGNLFFNYMLFAYIHGAQTFVYGDTLADCQVNFDSPEAIQAFQTIADLAQCESPEVREGVAVSGTLGGTNNWAMIMKNTPIADYLQIKELGLTDKYKIYNAPVISTGEYKGIPSPYFGDENLAMYKDSDAKEWVWEFIKFMTTDEVATQWIVDNLIYPNNKEAIDAVMEIIDERTADVMNRAMSTMPENFNGSTNDNFNNVSFGSVTANLTTAVDDVINGRQTAEEAAEFMQGTVEEFLSISQ